MARSRAKDHDEKRGAILRQAAIVFARDGYDRASMARLAAECGVSKALLYHYYTSKEALLFDILQSHLAELVDVVEEADDPALDPHRRLERLVVALLEAYRDADDQHQVQLASLSLLPEAEQQELKSLERRLVAIFSQAIRDVEPALFEDKALLKPVTMSLFGMLNWVYMWFRDGGALSREGYGKLATRLLVGGLRELAR